MRAARIPLAVAMTLGIASAAARDRDVDPHEHAVALQRAGLAGIVRAMDAAPDLFPSERQATLRMLSPEQKERALSFWGAFGDRLLGLEGIARHHADFADHEDADRHRRFELHRAAFLAGYRFAMDFIERVERDPGLHRLLNEPHPSSGLPEGAYARLQLRYLHLARASEYAALQITHRAWASRPPERLAAGVREDAASIARRGLASGPRMTAANALRVLSSAARSAWLPVQENAARWAGEVRVRRVGEALISPAQIAALGERLEPGDILLQRREWYLTNAGIPGYWTHAALYVGTPSERRVFFGDAPGAEPPPAAADAVEARLRRANPSAYDRSLEPEAGHARRVLEAIAEGVSFTSLEHSAAADAIAVLRPRLGRRDRAVALERAFRFAGRPYDYEFDFLTDAALVCSELVYKAFQAEGDGHGLRLPLATLAGKLMMTPNQIARQFSLERGRPDAQLAFVAMLDGDERRDRAHPASEETFADSWRRPKWHILTAAPAPSGR